MLELIILYRSLQLFAHSAHNLCKGKEFHQDHEFFGGLYPTAEGYYDSVIERAIGTYGESRDLTNQSILPKVIAKIQDSPSIGSSNEEFYRYALDLCDKILKKIESLAKGGQLSQGTINLIVGQADAIEVLIYKIKQRLR